mgnify:CR=1 FL=1
MNYVIEPPIGALNTALNTGLTNMSGSSKVLLGMIVGGMMSIDMGGPFNKAAYVFGTASIAAGNYDIMASVMIGGMVPPCAIALATLLFKQKFTKEERESGPVNFIMGLAFITEGAIPFAASDPLHVLPSCIVGAAAAGALSMAFWMYIDGSARWNLCIPGCGTCSDVSGSSGDRNDHRSSTSWTVKEKGRRIKNPVMKTD